MVPSLTGWLAAFILLYVALPYLQGYAPTKATMLSGLIYAARVFDGGAWNYCFAVPFLSAWMVWTRREEWRGFVPETDGQPLWIILLGPSLFLYWLGYVIEVAIPGYLSLHLFIGAMIAATLGVRAFRRLLSPWLFLLFAFPMSFLDNLIAFPLRLVMTGVAHGVLTALGLANVQVGTAILSAAKPMQGIRMGDIFSIDVADPCSGIRSLFALLMMATLYGYFTLSPGWRRGVLVLLAVPLALAGNVVRIVLLVFGVLMGGAPFAIGTLENPSLFHEGVGLAVYAVALGGLVFSSWLLERRSRRAKSEPSQPEKPVS